MKTYNTTEWRFLQGISVDVFLDGDLYRSGVVDDTMPDNSALWLAAHGTQPRQYVDKAGGYVVVRALLHRPLHAINAPNSA